MAILSNKRFIHRSHRFRIATPAALAGAVLLPALLGASARPAQAQFWYHAVTNDSINGINDSGTIYNTVGGALRTNAGETSEQKVGVYANAGIGRLGTYSTATYKLMLPWGSNLAAVATSQAEFGDALTIKGSGYVTVRLGVALHGDYQITGLGQGTSNASTDLRANWLSTGLGSCGQQENSQQGMSGTNHFHFTVPAGSKINISSRLITTAYAQSMTTVTSSYHNTARVFAIVEDSPGASIESASGHRYEVAAPDAYETNYGTPLTVAAEEGVLKNDIDTDGSGPKVLSAVLETTPAHGSLTLNPDGSFTYAPEAGFSGQDSFTYKAQDGELSSNAATVTITVGAAAPVNQKPAADAKQVTTDEDTAIAVTLSGSDPDGDALTYSVVSQPGNGTLSGQAPNLTYTPHANWSGTDTFTYNVNDGTADSNTATVTITVNRVNDAPVANNDEATAPAGTSVDISVTANDSDADGDALTVQSITQPTQGTATVIGNSSVRYTPSPDSGGTDTFTYTISDGNGGTATATIRVEILARDVTSQVSVTGGKITLNRKTGHYTQVVTLKNNGSSAITGPVSLVLDNLTGGVTLANRNGNTLKTMPAGSPYINVNVGTDGVLSAGERATVTLEFASSAAVGANITYTCRVLAGPGAR